MKLLLTGGAGFIGSHIVDRVIARGGEAIIVDNLTTGRRQNINPAARFYECDIRDAGSLKNIFLREKPDVVSHHSAQTDVRRSMKDPSFDAEVNIVGSVNVIELAVQCNCRKFIFASTSAVYPDLGCDLASEAHPTDPMSAYGVSKATTESYLKLYSGSCGLRSVVFRYGNVYGPRQDPHAESGVVAIFSLQMLSGIQPRIYGDGNKTRDYVFIDDVVAANLRAIESEDVVGTFNIGCSRPIRDCDVFAAVKRATGAQTDPVHHPRRPGELQNICLDAARARQSLGWAPCTAFEEGVPVTVDHYRQVTSLIPAQSDTNITDGDAKRRGATPISTPT